jgi:hypothetical protein
VVLGKTYVCASVSPFLKIEKYPSPSHGDEAVIKWGNTFEVLCKFSFFSMVDI